MKTERMPYLDVAKGIGIILVVAGHVMGEGGKPFLWSSIINEYIYSFHMALFFIISGMLLRYSLLNRSIALKDVKKKSMSIAGRLLFPYFLWSIIYFILYNKQLDINICKEWFFCIITFRGRAPIWFLGALFWAELFAINIIWISKQKTSLVTASTIVCIAIVIFICPHYDLSTIDSMILQYLAVFVLRGALSLAFVLMGYLILPIVLLEKPLITYIIGWIISLSLSVLFYSLGGSGNFHTLTIQNIYTYILTGLFGSAGIIFFCRVICHFVKLEILQHIGKEDTLGIMCIHYSVFPFMQYATDICNRLEIAGFPAFAVSFIFVFGASLLLTEVLLRKRIV